MNCTKTSNTSWFDLISSTVDFYSQFLFAITIPMAKLVMDFIEQNHNVRTLNLDYFQSASLCKATS